MHTLKIMNKNTKAMHRNDQKRDKGKTDSSGKLRVLSLVVLAIMILSLFLRVSGVGRGTRAQPSGGTAARILVFHYEEAGSCEDLTVTATGNAVFSNCGNSIEKQYVLNNSERSQLQSWLDTYSPVSYDPTPAGGATTQLYLNGRGNQQASDAEIQQMTGFAMQLAEKISLSS
jgi:hypothetical protein